MLYPMNKYLLIRVIEEEKTETGVLVPEDFKTNNNPYSLVTLLRCHDSSNMMPGVKLIVPTHMIEQIDLFGENYSVILENNVIGFFDN
mgnify:CR=1 FL=1